MTGHERSGWRDEEISARHRAWGVNCPAVDLDFLMVEYNVGAPVALVEYKHHRAQEPNLKHATYLALVDLADSAGLPFVVAFYWPKAWTFRVLPINGFAKRTYSGKGLLSERRFVESLYHLRGLKIEERVLANLNTTTDPQEGLEEVA